MVNKLANGKWRMVNLLAWVYLGLIALLPFHALLTTWAGSNFGHLDAWRIWKELIIFASFPLVAWVAVRDKDILGWLKKSWLVRLVGLYILLGAASGGLALAFGRVEVSALIYGLFADFRFVGFLLLVMIVARRSDVLRRHVTGVVIAGGLLVVLFGVLQLTVLPHDFLRHFGYGPDTIPAFQTVDNKVSYQRLQSTLRGANPLGAYLVVIGTLILAFWRARLPHFSWRWTGFGFLTAIVLLFSYSRSAYLGMFVSAVVLAVASSSRRHIKYMAVGAGVLLTLIIGLTVVFRNNNSVQNVIFHTDESSRSAQSTNAARTVALKDGLRDVVREPLGRGVGTAGPASTRNTGHLSRISENYFLQIGQEMGWLGVILFTAINLYVGRLLWQARKDKLALALFCSLIGLTLINLVSHAWPDDTLGLLWWGLAGVALADSVD